MLLEDPRVIRGWLLDVYPSDFGKVAVWVITEKGERIKLTDKFQPCIYVSGRKDELETLISRLYNNQKIASVRFVQKYAQATDAEKSTVLEVTVKDCRAIRGLTLEILRMGDYLRYELHNCDIQNDRSYLFSRGLFPLAYMEVKYGKSGLDYALLDSVESIDYVIPQLRVLRLEVDVAKTGIVAGFDDEIRSITLKQDGEDEIAIDYGDEATKLLQLVYAVNKLDPDIILTQSGDSYLFPYLIRRATVNNVIDQFVLSRENKSFSRKNASGKTFFSYGHTFYRASTVRLYGRIHIDQNNTFIMTESGFDGLIEIARTCRVPLHTAARFSIGSSMSSIQYYQAMQDDILLPRNKKIPEAFKSALDLLVGDRGGLVFEPRLGLHDSIGEVDFSSMYPSLMAKYNISAETVLCKCCPDSPIRIPDLNYHICTKRVGMVPKTVKLALTKRLSYKRLRDETSDKTLKQVCDKRQTALKWILVTCFGYLGFSNAKFGSVDGHIGVCAFAREAFLKATHIAEDEGFEVIHGIVDSLWLKKENATMEEYRNLCRVITDEIGVPINFEGRYKWIVFLPSTMHPRVSVLNRYFGAMDNGKVKVRGLEVRRSDTPRFIYDLQMEMINVLASANNSVEFTQKIPAALQVVKAYRQKLIDGEVPVWDLIITKHLSKDPKSYRQHVSQVIVAEQLVKKGVEVHAGNNLAFVFTDSENKRYHRRVLAEQLIEKGVHADTKKYLRLLYASAANLLSFKGYTTKSIHDAVNGQSISTLSKFLAS
ncbi:MAG: DNA polymerase domain-containing protein [Candidatus Bathyarchaeia archaeon]|jgi:DNA polymerase elongation subunit (family B)